MEQKERFTVRQLKRILRILVWGSVIGGFAIWLALPWNIPIYHTGYQYYNGSKLPLLIIPALPFFAFLQERSGPGAMDLHGEDSTKLQETALRGQRKNLKTGIVIATVEAAVVFAIMIAILIVSG